MMSPHPDARSRNGDSAITPVSMITAIGVWAPMLTFSPSFWIDAREDTTPSWLAAVGTLTNGTPALKEAHFATSMERPPPTPMANSKSPLRIRSSPSRTSSQVSSGIRYSEWRIFRPVSSFSTVFPAILIVFSSATIKAFLPSFRAWQTSPTARRASWPMTMFRGSSIAFDLLNASVSNVPMAVASGPRPRRCPYLTLTTWMVESFGNALTPDPHRGTFKGEPLDRKSTRLNSSHGYISYAVFCLKKKTIGVADHLLDKWQMIVYTKGRTPDSAHDYVAPVNH